MKITIEDDEGRQMSLETVLTVIPAGHSVLICPADKDFFLGDAQRVDLKEQLQALGIRAVVTQTPVCVWAIADAPA